jgi:hypothetical protein
LNIGLSEYVYVSSAILHSIISYGGLIQEISIINFKEIACIILAGFVDVSSEQCFSVVFDHQLN